MDLEQQPALHWNQRSVVHEQKLQLLQNTAEDQLRRIEGYVTCRQDPFKVGGPTSDGTCVYVGLRVSDGKEVAVKWMLTDSCEHLAKNETKIFGMLKMEKSPHIVRYLHYKKENPFVFIILELCEFSLKEYVNKARDSPDHIPFDAQKIIKEILTGLDVLHKQRSRNDEKILHRDLKPDNVLVDVEWSIRLADFGVSKTIDEEGSSTNYTSGKGNAEWQATESIPINGENQEVVYKRRSDIQVAGMLSFYVLTKGGHPFGDISYERPNNIYQGTPDILTDPVEKDFVSWLIQKDINDRPFADEALKHPFLKSVEDQFNFLVVMGNETEVVKEDQDCAVIRALNSHSNDYPNGWKEKIPRIVRDFSRGRNQYNNNITSLLRFLRNVKEHITHSSIRLHIGEPATYFLDRERFSTLPMLVHKILREQAKDVARRESNEEVWINRLALKSFV